MDIKKIGFFFLSFICSISVFCLSILFQKMAYWGSGLLWYWIGIGLTYTVWLVGIILWIKGFTNKNGSYSFLIVSLITLIMILLILSFLWTTFVIVFGLSGK